MFWSNFTSIPIYIGPSVIRLDHQWSIFKMPYLENKINSHLVKSWVMTIGGFPIEIEYQITLLINYSFAISSSRLYFTCIGFLDFPYSLFWPYFSGSLLNKKLFNFCIVGARTLDHRILSPSLYPFGHASDRYEP